MTPYIELSKWLSTLALRDLDTLSYYSNLLAERRVLLISEGSLILDMNRFITIIKNV